MANAFLDSNVFIYATSPAPPGANCRTILELASGDRSACATSAEVLQEILHVLGRRDQQSRVLAALSIALRTARVYAIEARDVLAAARLDVQGLSARDRLHVAIVQRYQIDCVISADKGFDRVPGITRLDPANLEDWREIVFGS